MPASPPQEVPGDAHSHGRSLRRLHQRSGRCVLRARQPAGGRPATRRRFGDSENRCGQARPERPLAGPDHRQLRHPGARGAPGDGDAARPRGAPARQGGAGPRRHRRRALGHGHCRWRRAALPAGRPGAEEEEPGELADARPRDQVLPAGRPARHLHAVPVPDRPERQRVLHGLRVRGRGSQHLPEGSRTATGRLVDGAVGRPVGRRHVRHRRRTASTTRPGSIAPATSTASS